MEFLSHLQQWYDGLISEAELHDLLDKLQIRGGLEVIRGGRSHGVKFCGFDYRNQRWIKIEIC